LSEKKIFQKTTYMLILKKRLMLTGFIFLFTGLILTTFGGLFIKDAWTEITDRNKQSKPKVENSKPKFLDTLTKTTEEKKIDSEPKVLHSSPKTITEEKIKEQSPVLNAPNALIATIGQTGGTNIIEQKIDAPNPSYIAVSEEMNIEVDKIDRRDTMGKPVNFPSDEYPFQKLFKHTFVFRFYSPIPINGFGLVLKRKDVIIGRVSKIGMVTSSSGKTKDSYYQVFATRPENGEYTFVFYTIDKMNGYSELQFYKNI
jgi:hypothetical protein